MSLSPFHSQICGGTGWRYFVVLLSNSCRAWGTRNCCEKDCLKSKGAYKPLLVLERQFRCLSEKGHGAGGGEVLGTSNLLLAIKFSSGKWDKKQRNDPDRTSYAITHLLSSFFVSGKCNEIQHSPLFLLRPSPVRSTYICACKTLNVARPANSTSSDFSNATNYPTVLTFFTAWLAFLVGLQAISLSATFIPSTEIAPGPRTPPRPTALSIYSPTPVHNHSAQSSKLCTGLLFPL